MVNRPNFDLSKFDSKDEANTDGINPSIRKNGKKCIYGTMTRGTQIAAKISVGGKDRLEILTSDDEFDSLHGDDCDWN